MYAIYLAEEMSYKSTLISYSNFAESENWVSILHLLYHGYKSNQMEDLHCSSEVEV